MEYTPLLDCVGRRRSPATTSSFHKGLAPRNKGLRYPPDPPTVEEIVAVMRAAGDGPEGVRLRATRARSAPAAGRRSRGRRRSASPR
jgi:hypothetical protein